jgi:hypothetical protein
MRWAVHVARIGAKRNVCRILVGKPEGRRPLGRPRRRWVNNIKMYLREIGWDDIDWIDLAQDRDQWKVSCEHGDETLGFLKCWEVPEWLDNFQLLRKGSAPQVSKLSLWYSAVVFGLQSVLYVYSSAYGSVSISSCVHAFDSPIRRSLSKMVLLIREIHVLGCITLRQCYVFSDWDRGLHLYLDLLSTYNSLLQLTISLSLILKHYTIHCSTLVA